MILKNDVYKHLIKKWGHTLEPFCEVLKKIVESKPNYYFGIQELAYRNWKKEIDDLTKNMNLVKADIFHQRSQKNKIEKFFNLLSNKKDIIIIGPEYLSEIKEFNIRHHIITPEYFVWNNIDELEFKINDYLKENGDQNLILLYSCSIAAKILIHKFREQKITQIDTGSLLDPYVGVNSRGYHIDVLKRLNIDESTFKYPKIK